MSKLRLLVLVTSLVALGVFVHGVYKLQGMQPFPTVKCFTVPPVDTVAKTEYPVGSFEHEHKKTIL